MGKKIIIAILAMQACFIECRAQVSHSKIFSSLQSERGKAFVDEKGRSVGCDGNLECLPFHVVVYSADYDKSSRDWAVSGNVYIAVAKSGDTLGVAGARILLAEPVKDTLKGVWELGRTRVDLDRGAVFPNRRGDFRLKFKVGASGKLYFAHGLYGLLEYNIDRVYSGAVML